MECVGDAHSTLSPDLIGPLATLPYGLTINEVLLVISRSYFRSQFSFPGRIPNIPLATNPQSPCPSIHRSDRLARFLSTPSGISSAPPSLRFTMEDLVFLLTSHSQNSAKRCPSRPTKRSSVSRSLSAHRSNMAGRTLDESMRCRSEVVRIGIHSGSFSSREYMLFLISKARPY